MDGAAKKEKRKEKNKKKKTSCDPQKNKEEKMNIEKTIQDLEQLSDAVKNFAATVGIMQTFGPDSLPEHMACGEANVFNDLFEALGLTEEASNMRRWHLEAEEVEEKNESHPDWPEG